MSRSRSFVRIAVSLVVIVAALGVAFFAAQDVMLKTDRLRRLINTKPDRTLLEYTGARSRGPGRIELDTLTLRIRDDNIELRARLEGVSLRVALRDLTRRRFHVTSLQAQRLTFRLRERLTPAEAKTVRTKLYPPIDGFPDPPIRSPDEKAQRSEGRWRIVVDHLDVARVQELWVNTWHFTGDGRVNGGFELLPGREAVVGPATLTIVSGDLRRGDPVASAIKGEIRAKLPRFSPRQYPGNDVWKIMTGGAELRAQLASVGFLTDGSEGAKLSGGRGPVSADLEMRDGLGDLRVDADAREVVYRSGGRVIRGTARLDLRGSRLDFIKQRMALSGSRLALSNVSVDGSQRSDPWSSTLRAPKASYSLKSGALSASMEGSFRDARPVVAMVPSGLGRKVADMLDLDGLKVSGHVRLGKDVVEITSGRGQAGNVTIDAEYRKQARSERGAILVKKGLLTFGVELHDGKATVKPFATHSWFRREEAEIED